MYSGNSIYKLNLRNPARISIFSADLYVKIKHFADNLLENRVTKLISQCT